MVILMFVDVIDVKLFDVVFYLWVNVLCIGLLDIEFVCCLYVDYNVMVLFGLYLVCDVYGMNLGCDFIWIVFVVGIFECVEGV